MIRIVSLLTCTLLMCLSITLTPPEAGAVGEASCAENLYSVFSAWGESQHWALILQGLGSCRENQLDTAKALPYLVWTGGDVIPERVNVRFSIGKQTCIEGIVGVPPTKVVRLAGCKLFYPSQGILVANNPADLVRAIMSEGDFEIRWGDTSERITWRYGNPPY